MNYTDWKNEIATANTLVADTYGVDIRIEEYNDSDYYGVKVDGMDPWAAHNYGLALCEAAMRARTIEGYPED